MRSRRSAKRAAQHAFLNSNPLRHSSAQNSTTTYSYPAPYNPNHTNTNAATALGVTIQSMLNATPRANDGPGSHENATRPVAFSNPAENQPASPENNDIIMVDRYTDDGPEASQVGSGSGNERKPLDRKGSSSSLRRRK
ncbi:hypothetical protein CI109_103157 [Kwoniella shandongensis]|uniref:Uncharacterized protein n=1 Tax=Kwoniella shandongensis TaxID=1734106 RepID=A0A5M6C8M0_9TREE|nr:uncharacterized protein CI109_000348 [Kwoniella shandongensis]KAA5531506.1 hypothetical protein CI109_000348 [Kwoniella shandongensis]